jgi:uncharacterized C2H2 Zn-finger protein
MSGKVYRVISPSHPELVYYGSTSNNYLCNRMSQHRTDYKRYPNAQRAVFELVKYDDAKIELVEETTIEEMKSREQWYISNHECVNKLNAYLPGDPAEKLKQWKKDNPEKQRMHLKAYYEKHKGERILCPHCQMEMLKQSLTRHIKRTHPLLSL